MTSAAEPQIPRLPRKPANDPQVPHVALAIKAIMKEVRKEGISKDRKNQQQSYNFRGIDDVLNVLSGMLPEADLIVIPRMLSRTQVERTTAKGGVLFFSTVEADYTFQSTIDGSERLVGPFYGEAMDSADKATNKAMSAAYKYMAIQTFCIPTEGDNDADATTHDVVPRAAGENPPSQSPEARQPRRTNVVINPATGHKIDTENARNQRSEWARFTDRVQGYVEARDADGLRLWFTSDEIAAFVAGWVFKDEADEHFEKALEIIEKAERS